MDNLTQFTEAFIEALYFTDTGTDTEINENTELSDETRLDIEADCRSFWRRYGCFIMSEECTFCNDTTNPSQAGHDFALTRNGHGTGFWDGDWSDNYADMLTQGSKNYGQFDIYQGDDGKIYS